MPFNRKTDEDWGSPVLDPLPADPRPHKDTARAHRLLSVLLDGRDMEVARLTAELLGEVADVRTARKRARR